ncbi:hypothetical protein TWF102_008123 [Orbilia oligospora]|uniref:Peptidase A1 domain-containing protein n=1 Tax=Orbilia oligospora TaxID=2813651 RepID=A0A7C8JG88_ORBOL|nr:hypothetical protein TWF102_008123 [Orbilia oligospora]KAF3114853.1 hypothetical protein TWF103_000577 [Orbilia oligospora]
MVGLSLSRSGTILLALASTLSTGVEAVSIYDRATDYISESVKLVKRVATDPVLFKYSVLRYAFFVNLEIGSREDSVNVRLTDQPWFWVGSKKPANCSREESRSNYLQCVYVDWSGLYSPNRSSTFRNVSDAVLSLTQSDSSRFTRGYYGTDTVKFGDSTLDNVYIGVANNFTQAPEMGIGVYDNDRQTFPSFMESLLQGREIKSLTHGLYFNWFERNESYLTFGSVDTAKYDGNLVTFNASTNGEITVVRLVGASFGSPREMEELNPVRNLRANVEFSTSRMSLPDDVIPTIVDRTGAVYDDNWGGYLVDCAMRDSDLIFEFRFEDVNITVNANHFILPAYGVLGYRYQLAGEDACSLQVNPMSKYSIATNLGYEAVLGTPFARHTYLVHDYTNRQLSFAPAKFNVTETNIVELDSRGVAPLFSQLPEPTPTEPPTNTDPPSPSPSGDSGGSKTNVGAIAGGAVGGVAAIAGLAILAFFMMKRRRQPVSDETLPAPPPPMMHNSMPASPQGGQAGYSHVPYYDVTKGHENARPVSELAGGDYNWNNPGAQPVAQGNTHPQFGAPYQGNTGYVNEAPGSQTFAHEMPAQYR